MTRHYPAGMAVKLNTQDWVSQHDAGKELGLPTWRVALLISNDHLEPAENDQREMGVSRKSLEAENHWRARTPWFKRMLRSFADIFRWF